MTGFLLVSTEKKPELDNPLKTDAGYDPESTALPWVIPDFRVQ